MKAFDSFLDKQSRDKGLDSTSNRLFSREIDVAIRSQFQEKQRLTVASNYFALACPILPVGLLGAFMLLDRLDRMGEPEPGMTKADEVARQNREASQQMYLLAMRQKAEREKAEKDGDGRSNLSCSRPVDLIGKPKKRKDVSLQPEGKRSEQVMGPSLLSKQRNDVSKLVKQKMALEAHLDKMSQEQDYALHCRLSAQLDLLDKALKKLGA